MIDEGSILRASWNSLDKHDSMPSKAGSQRLLRPCGPQRDQRGE